MCHRLWPLAYQSGTREKISFILGEEDFLQDETTAVPGANPSFAQLWRIISSLAGCHKGKKYAVGWPGLRGLRGAAEEKPWKRT
jgi:hypothetical protein